MRVRNDATLTLANVYTPLDRFAVHPNSCWSVFVEHFVSEISGMFFKTSQLCVERGIELKPEMKRRHCGLKHLNVLWPPLIYGGGGVRRGRHTRNRKVRPHHFSRNFVGGGHFSQSDGTKILGHFRVHRGLHFQNFRAPRARVTI